MKRISISLLFVVLVATSLTGYAQDDTSNMAVINQPEVAGTNIAPSILDYGAVKDAYGGRIAARYFAIQVDIENQDERPLWIKGLTMGLDPAQCEAAKIYWPDFNITRCRETYNRLVRYPAGNAPTDQRILIAVSQMGAFQSRRAQIFRLIEFGLSIAPVFAPYVNATQAATIAGAAGIGLPALQRLFPDFSGKQLQALADTSYRQGLIVGPKMSESFIIFVPSDRFFDSTTWGLYTDSAQKQSPLALETKQFLQMVLMVRDRSVYITTEPAPEGSSNSLIRRR